MKQMNGLKKMDLFPVVSQDQDFIFIHNCIQLIKCHFGNLKAMKELRKYIP